MASFNEQGEYVDEKGMPGKPVPSDAAEITIDPSRISGLEGMQEGDEVDLKIRVKLGGEGMSPVQVLSIKSEGMDLGAKKLREMKSRKEPNLEGTNLSI